MAQQTTAHDANGPAQIAAQLAVDRKALAASVDALCNRFAAGRLMADGVAALQQVAAPAVQAAGRTMERAGRASPVALGLTGVGLAWLMLGGSRPAGDAAAKTAALGRWEDEGGPVATTAQVDTAWIAEIDTLCARATSLVARIDRAAQDGLVPLAALQASRADVMASLSHEIGRTMASGIAGVPDDTREQIIIARAALYQARQTTPVAGAAAARHHPMLTGAMLAAAGVALGAVLPQGRAEHHLIGPLRDGAADMVRTLLRDAWGQMSAPTRISEPR